MNMVVLDIFLTLTMLNGPSKYTNYKKLNCIISACQNLAPTYIGISKHWSMGHLFDNILACFASKYKIHNMGPMVYCVAKVLGKK